VCAPRTAARDFHNGSFEAHVKPQGDTITFEDDGGCGGAAVTFTGLYRRESKSAR